MMMEATRPGSSYQTRFSKISSYLWSCKSETCSKVPVGCICQPALGNCLMLKLLLNKEAGLFLVSPETLPAISGVALPRGTCWNLRVVRPVLAQAPPREMEDSSWKEPPTLEAKKERTKGNNGSPNHIKDLTRRLSIFLFFPPSISFPPRSSSRSLHA